MTSDFKKDAPNKKDRENARFLDMPENEGKSMPPAAGFIGGTGLGVGLGTPLESGGGASLSAFQEEVEDDNFEESEQSALKRLDEILNYWNVPEEEVIELMGQLTRAEANSMFTSSSYKSRVTGALNDEEMFQAMFRVNSTLFRKLTWCFFEGTRLNYALNLINAASASEKRAVASSTTMMNNFVQLCDNRSIVQVANALNLTEEQRGAWLEAEGVNSYEIEHADTFQRTLEGVQLNSSLYSRAVRMGEYLIKNNLVKGNVIFKQGVFGKADAHRNSTAFAIRQGWVGMSDLQALVDGRDSDGNLWYQEGWSQEVVIEHATQIWPGSQAGEGYIIGDRRRAPNADAVPMSSYAQGEAMEILVEWSSGEEWAEQSTSIVAYFGLERTKAEDPSHFELKV